MIGRLSGTLIAKKNTAVLIDVQGVGYECQIPFSDTLMLGEAGSSLILWTHLQIKEDAHELYGFLSQPARQFFRLLIKISGVGPKMALTILSGVDLPGFMQAVERQDTACLKSLPGIGQKTAERLMLELRDKFKKNPAEWQVLAASSLELPKAVEPENQELVLEAPINTKTNKTKTTQATSQSTQGNALDTKEAMNDAISALINLGYKPPDAYQAVSRAFQQASSKELAAGLSSEILIREALKGFSRV
jgi:Holliday junction DNA helicase RuvA